jgi:hypothetical protein
VKATGADRQTDETIRVALRPERWLTVDYAKQFPAVS